MIEAGSAALGEVVTLQRGTTYKSALLDRPGPVLLGLASINRNGGFRSDSLRTYGGESPDRLLLRPGDLYVSLKDVTQSGDLLGSVSRVPVSIEMGRLTQDTLKLTIADPRFSASYLYWALRTPRYREYCRAHAIGTTNLSLSREDFLAFAVPVPGPAELRRVELLEALDGRIELNCRMSGTLEATARALFKSWFVDFDPVRAKIEGRDPGLPPHLADLFPASFVDSELGEVPEGWIVQPLDQIATFTNGLALQRFPPTDGRSLPVIKISQLRAGSTVGAERASAQLPPAYVVHDGDVLFSWSGTLEVDLWRGGTGALNQHLFKVTSDTFPNWFCYLWTRHHLPTFRAIAAGKATTMGHIQRGHLTAARVVVPDQPLLDAASRHFEPTVDRVVLAGVQARTLADTRDTLLPKLISGELRVRDAERMVETGT